MIYIDGNPSNVAVGLFVIVSSIVLSIREISPSTRLGYSKFTNPLNKSWKVSGRSGMLLIYGPSLALSSILFCVSDMSSRLYIVTGLTAFHYSKRVYEVYFIHHYSGQIIMTDAITIAFSYMFYSIFVYVYSDKVPNAMVNMTWMKVGIVLFLMGESFNFHHHMILSELRKDGSKEYKIPEEGLFKYCWCPHYVSKYK
ncbi:hypothetical protein BDB01DRAFT_810469 [Pilobolus umbonatus]|nr:hypothetical protein BDB01DRAFT_810469 [Pilobolus umbonatus]